MTSAPPRKKKTHLLQLVAIVFFTVSGGPYGLEPLLTYAGSHAALLLMLTVPLLWDLPAIFTVLELNSMMPVTGGYYQWVKYTLGRRWGFYEGWWTWIYTFVDLAFYPVIFVQCASYIFPLVADHKMLVYLLIIWSSAGLNILGITQVGKASLILSVLVIVPFLILFGVGIWQHQGSWALPVPSLRHMPVSSLGLALYTIMWNCLGWDNITTYAQEVDKPVRSYIIAVFTAFALTMAVYGLVVYIAQQSGINPAVLKDAGFPILGQHIGGRWLGVVIAAGGMASSLGLYSAVLLSVSRVPQVMADDRLLPRFLHNLHPRYQTPYIVILLCSFIVSLMVLWSFEALLVIDVTVYGAGLSLEYISLIKLRLHEPQRHRPFKIPLNVAGLLLMIALPLGVYAVALTGAFTSEQEALRAALFAVGTLLTAEVVWQFIRLKERLTGKRLARLP